MSDMINHPQHYCDNSKGIEVIDVIDAFTESLHGVEATDTGNVIKYICRWSKKNGLEDLKKARWYINHLIGCVEKSDCGSWKLPCAIGIDQFQDNDFSAVTFLFPPKEESTASNPGPALWQPYQLIFDTRYKAGVYMGYLYDIWYKYKHVTVADAYLGDKGMIFNGMTTYSTEYGWYDITEFNVVPRGDNFEIIHPSPIKLDKRSK